MKLIFVKLSKVFLLLQFSQLQKEWLLKLLFFTSALLPCFLTSGHKLCSCIGMGTMLPVLLTIEVSNLYVYGDLGPQRAALVAH